MQLAEGPFLDPVKLCTAKLCLENQNKTYRDQSYPKAFPLLNKRESNFPCSLAQVTPDNKATLQHTLCFSRSGLSQRRSLGIQFKYCSKVTKTKEGFLSKLQTGFQS